MKKWVSSLAIISLLAVSTIVIYKEALAIPMLCDTMEQECWECNGSFYYLWCEDYDRNGNNLIDCEFCCYGIYLPPPSCEWGYFGQFCGLCVL